MLPNMGYYVQAVDRMVKETEEIGETMHPNTKWSERQSTKTKRLI